jgi:salicylate 5-hydroxylase large subunit
MADVMNDGQMRSWPNERWTRVPNWAYTDPAVFAREQERIFEGASWLYTCLEAEIPNTGDFKRSQLGTKQVVAVRDAKGGVNVLLNRCAHRSAQFCNANLGTMKEIVCPYHQWTYDLEGKLVGVPFRRGYRGQGGMPDDFKMEEYGLRRLRVTCRGGVVFSSFSDATEPFEAYLGKRQLEIFDRVFDGRPLEVMGYMRQRIPSNWKLMFENLKDPYHASLLHVFLITFGLFRLDQRSEVEIDDSGRHATLVSRRGEQVVNEATREMRQFRKDFALQDTRLLEPIREFSGDATVAMQTLWPNIIIQQQSNTLAMRQLVPIDPGHFDLSWTFFGYEGDTPELRQRRLRQANLMGPAGFVSLDDSEVLLLQQWGVNPNPESSMLIEMGGRDVKSETHMVTEAGLRAFYKYYADVMGF